MNSLIKFSNTILLYFLALLVITKAQDPNYLHHVCADTTTSTTTYKDNLNLLLSSLASNSTHNNIGFFTSSAGQDPDTVYGLFFCRGDLSTEVCQNCVAYATKDIVQRCPTRKGALIWYDPCFLRYSNKTISALEEDPNYLLMNTQNQTIDVDFNKFLVNTISTAASQAVDAPAGAKRFGATKANYTWQDTLYVLVQCTPDLSSSDCNQCLAAANSSLQVCCNVKRGGRILLPCCNVGFEMYPNYNETYVEAASAPTPVGPVPKGKNSFSSFSRLDLRLPPKIIIDYYLPLYLPHRKRKKKQNLDYNRRNSIGSCRSTTDRFLRLLLVEKEERCTKILAATKLIDYILLGLVIIILVVILTSIIS
ncbi:unnamed protein product [Dovyalis caffra]|uniref:Gnk2-homologous domain-containing protein n=1 Tax=Dovyalis caffra TaxID=77055 RepID=A0AAV1SKA1_9ROSI|nr:unnamed protein product [Dovyalis caffra]